MQPCPGLPLYGLPPSLQHTQHQQPQAGGVPLPLGDAEKHNLVLTPGVPDLSQSAAAGSLSKPHSDVSLEQLRVQQQLFATEREWDQVWGRRSGWKGVEDALCALCASMCSDP